MTRLVRPVAVLALAVGSCAAASPALADGLEHEWASDSVHLAWDGSTYAVTTASFLGAPVTVPGDRAVRTLEVTNGGPTAGMLEAWIVDVELEGDLGSGFFDELTVDWTAEGRSSVRALADAGRTRMLRTELAPGESTALTLGYELALTATAGNRSAEGPLGASFDVELRIAGVASEAPPDDGGGTDGPPGGDGPDDGGPPDVPDDGKTPDDDGSGPPDDDPEVDDDAPRDERAPRDDLAETGSELASLGALVAGLLALGVALVVAARRRRRQHG